MIIPTPPPPKPSHKIQFTIQKKASTMPAIRKQTTLANRTGVVFALNTPMREIRYLQTRILTGIQAIDQFILNYNIHLINRERTTLLILRMHETPSRRN